MTLTAVSLFAGVGGFDLALERNGVNVVAAVEIDNNARGVLAHRFPNTTLFTDVCEVNGGQLIAAGFVPERGIITGGFPCQDLSVAGKRAGLDGARSGLFWEICRLLDETKARYFILENVPGLLSSNAGRDMGAVVGALVDRGYGIAYRVLDAQFFGVPQRRRRVVIVGCLGDDGNASSQILALSEGVRGHLETRTTTRQTVTKPITNRLGDDGGLIVGDGSPVSGTVSSKWAKGTGGPAGDEHYNLVTYVKAKRAQSATDDESWRADSIAPTVNSFDIGDTRATVAITTSTVRRLTPMECERLQGFPDNWTAERYDYKKQQIVPQADSARYKQMGNAVAVPVVEWIAARLVAAHTNALLSEQEGVA